MRKSVFWYRKTQKLAQGNPALLQVNKQNLLGGHQLSDLLPVLLVNKLQTVTIQFSLKTCTQHFMVGQLDKW